MSEEYDDLGQIDESSDEDINEERDKLKKLGFEQHSKDSFGYLFDAEKEKRKKKQDHKPFRGFN